MLFTHLLSSSTWCQSSADAVLVSRHILKVGFQISCSLSTDFCLCVYIFKYVTKIFTQQKHDIFGQHTNRDLYSCMNHNLIIGEGFVPQGVMFSTAVDHDASVRTELGGSGLGEGLISEGLWPGLSWASQPSCHPCRGPQEEDLTVRNLCHGHPLCGGEELELKHEAETQIQAHLRVQLVFWKQSREKKQEQKDDGSSLRTVTLNNPSFSKKRTSSSTDCLSGTD